MSLLVINQITRHKKARLWGGALLCCLFFIFVTPKFPLFPEHHLFADMRNFLGVPNTLNVITNFPFLIVGVVGFVLSLDRGVFNISSRREVWGWAIFYAGIAAVAFGSAHYHLQPDDDRVMWDTLPMMIAYSSLLSSFLFERVGERVGLSCLIAFILSAFLSMNYARTFNDFRLCMIFQLIPCIVIPALTFLLPPKYTHSKYWLYSAGVHLLSKFEAVADRKIYHANGFVISGHSLEHLCSAMVPILLTVMLVSRCKKSQRNHRESQRATIIETLCDIALL